MRRLICVIIFINFLLIFMPGKSYCYAADSKLELDWDYLTTSQNDRDLDTVSLHILKKISGTKNKSIYRGITITRPLGNVTLEHQTQSQDSSAVGIGPIYMIRAEKPYAGKLSAALDMSGGVILYDKPFPAGGRYYDFMWRVGPKFIYKFNDNSSINVGYMLMHVSNGFKTHNPGYDAHGISFGFVTNY
ncbi:Lipid A 3-O-deacylase (PagL) [Sporomusa ovata DSM 2662]|nr:acyloxyacyl hydrolase [Sporomusa ovata]EQB28612.1 lipid A 3-O-deacylase PagL [Sporomusa ovata DSM 2662]